VSSVYGGGPSPSVREAVLGHGAQPAAAVISVPGAGGAERRRSGAATDGCRGRPCRGVVRRRQRARPIRDALYDAGTDDTFLWSMYDVRRWSIDPKRLSRVFVALEQKPALILFLSLAQLRQKLR
jgi:hypothetical protein